MKYSQFKDDVDFNFLYIGCFLPDFSCQCQLYIFFTMQNNISIFEIFTAYG